MTSQQIQYFLSAAKSLSFTKAAEEFFTSQPTVSRQIAGLEAELGFPLFHREGKQLRLTPGGLVMLSEFAEREASLQAAVQRVEQLRKGFQGSLSIAYLSGLDTDHYVYPPTMVFISQYPNVRVSIDCGSYGSLRQRLESGEYDVIFTYHYELPSIPKSLSQYVYRCGTALVTSSHHPLARKKKLVPSDLHGQTLILPTESESQGRVRDVLDLLSQSVGCTQEDFSRMTIRTVDTLETKEFLVRSGVGISVTGNCMDLAYDSRYTLFPLPDQFFELHAVWLQNNLNPAIALYMQVLKQAPASDAPKGESEP